MKLQYLPFKKMSFLILTLMFFQCLQAERVNSSQQVSIFFQSPSLASFDQQQSTEQFLVPAPRKFQGRRPKASPAELRNQAASASSQTLASSSPSVVSAVSLNDEFIPIDNSVTTSPMAISVETATESSDASRESRPESPIIFPTPQYPATSADTGAGAGAGVNVENKGRDIIAEDEFVDSAINDTSIRPDIKMALTKDEEFKNDLQAAVKDLSEKIKGAQKNLTNAWKSDDREGRLQAQKELQKFESAKYDIEKLLKEQVSAIEDFKDPSKTQSKKEEKPSAFSVHNPRSWDMPRYVTELRKKYGSDVPEQLLERYVNTVLDAKSEVFTAASLTGFSRTPFMNPKNVAQYKPQKYDAGFDDWVKLQRYKETQDVVEQQESIINLRKAKAKQQEEYRKAEMLQARRDRNARIINVTRETKETARMAKEDNEMRALYRDTKIQKAQIQNKKPVISFADELKQKADTMGQKRADAKLSIDTQIETFREKKLKDDVDGLIKV